MYEKAVTCSHFILIVKQPQNLFLFYIWVARRRARRECIACDTTRSPRSTVEEELERYEGVVSVPLSKGLFYEQVNEVATTGTPSYPSRSRLCLLIDGVLVSDWILCRTGLFPYELAQKTQCPCSNAFLLADEFFQSIFPRNCQLLMHERTFIHIPDSKSQGASTGRIRRGQ
jgi:hypothetical protein